jgi:hypothetical protein
VFVTGVVLIFQNADEDQLIINLMVVISSVLSFSVFLFFRLAYYTNIFRSVRLGSKVINRERTYNILVIFSSLARTALCLLSIAGVDLEQIRNYNSECHDTNPSHGVVLIFITICVDLLPPFVFTRIFTTF